MLRRLRGQMVLLNAAISGAILLAMALVALHVSEGVIAEQYERTLARNTSLMVSTLREVDAGMQVQLATDYLVYRQYGDKVHVTGTTSLAPETLTLLAQTVRGKVLAQTLDPNERAFFFFDESRAASPSGQAGMAPQGMGGMALRISMSDEMLSSSLEGDSFVDTVILRTEALDDAGDDVAVREAMLLNSSLPWEILDRYPLPQESEAFTAQADDVTIGVQISGVGDASTATLKAENVLFFQRAPLLGEPSGILVNMEGVSYRVEVPMISGAASAPQMLMVLQDRTEELRARAGLRWLFFGCAAGGLLLVLGASFYLSARSIRPVEQSIRRQREFVAAASHELRTPVAAVRANAEVLTDAALGDYAPYLDAIAQEGERMTHLVTDLMDLARADAEGLQVREEPVDLAEVALHTAEVLRPLAEGRGLTLTTDTQPALVKADSARLQQALVTLLDNALRYTPSGGHVRVEASRQGAHGALCVIDDGPGIPDDQKARVFDRFYRLAAARPADGGCGLGLSVAQQLVTQMGGTLRLTDAPGGGCVFEVRFRLLKER